MKHEPGTCLEVRKWGVVPHKMIYVGPIGPNGKDVINNVPGEVVHFDHYENAVAGRDVRVAEPAPSTPFEQRAAVNRAVGRLGEPYHLIKNNCEQMTWFARFGIAFSPLLAFCLVVVGIVIACAVFMPKLVRQTAFWIGVCFAFLFGLVFIVPKMVPRGA